ncbi:SDR family NAD(P)-dependent oxidoreductase [Fusobacterium russii]|uniref:SDR family NAD(P)-dependent oxidoreductase n=1 Tax=Fusobacterium russii TaxID=854 RepID=UPI0003A9FCDC|nr:SDR family NAD(P)-dependent oxidoreductase [Fusobacterium russii]
MKIFIAGGTSGIGLALAKKYLELGNEVGLCGRNLDKIKALARLTNLKTYQVDIYNKEDYYNAVMDFSKGELDLLISAAGIYVSSRTKKLSVVEINSMLRTNVIGTLNSFEIGKEIMIKNKSGHIVSLASVAALIVYPKASLYSKTKRAVISISDSYREALKDFNIKVSCIIPGYINTEKLRELNNGKVNNKIFIISEEKAVEEITNAISEEREEYIFPFKMKLLIKFLSLLPKKILSFILTYNKGEN